MSMPLRKKTASNNKTKLSSIVRKELRQNTTYYILALPGLISLLLFSYLPMAGLCIVFQRYTYEGGLFGSEFVGFKNFDFFFSNIHYALRATRNTLVVNIFTITLGIICPVSLAVMLNEITNKWFKKITQSMMILPHFVSWIVVGVLASSFFDEANGLLNRLLTILGNKPIMWYSRPWTWWPILILSSIWKGAGFSSIIYFAAITGFDDSYYEAAHLDGATCLQRIFYITVPLLKPTIVIMFLDFPNYLEKSISFKNCL